MPDLKVLIVEDDEDFAFLESDILKDELKCEVDIAESMEALSSLDISDYNVVLLDFNLPDGSGSEVLAKIRQEHNIPVIIVTAQKDMKIAIETLKEGANDFLEKSPHIINMLPQIVRRVYDRHKEEETLARKKEQQQALSTRVETLRQLLTTLAHYINNSTTTISGYAQLAEQFPGDANKINRLIKVSLKETQKISYVLEELESFVKNMEIKTTNYVDIPNAMFAIEENIAKKMRKIEEQE